MTRLFTPSANAQSYVTTEAPTLAPSVHDSRPADNMNIGNDPLAGWLLQSGFQDRDTAEAASRLLDTPLLRPLWQQLQQRMPSDRSRTQIHEATLCLRNRPPSDHSDLELRQQQQQLKLTRLSDRVRETKKCLLKAQVENLMHLASCHAVDALH